MSAESLKAGVLDLIQTVIIEDGDKWIVVCDDCERGQAREKDTALLSGPCYCKEFELYDGIASFCVREKTGAGLDEFPLTVVFLLKNKSKAEAACICEDPCRAGYIIKCKGGSSGQNLLGLKEGLSMSGVPQEVIPSTKERTDRGKC